MEEMFKEKMLETMWTSQVYGHHDKMAHTKNKVAFVFVLQ